MFSLNLVRDRTDVPASTKKSIRTAPPATAAKRQEAESAVAVPEKSSRRYNWFASFERMMAAYADLAIRDLRE